jgi:hypothetical protein
MLAEFSSFPYLGLYYHLIVQLRVISKWGNIPVQVGRVTTMDGCVQKDGRMVGYFLDYVGFIIINYRNII